MSDVEQRRFKLGRNDGTAAATLVCCLLAGVVDAQQIAGPILPPPRSPQSVESELIEDVVEPELSLELDPTRSKVIRTRFPVTRIAITDPDIMDLNQFSPNEFEFIGKEPGETTLSIWFTNELGDEEVLRYVVEVKPDASDERRMELEYGRLERRINEMFPDSFVRLLPIADKLVVQGQARDSEEASQILQIIGDGTGGFPALSGAGLEGVATIPGAEGLSTLSLVNLLRVPGEQQVMLKVRIADLSRTAMRELGFDFDALYESINLQHMIAGGGGNLTAILEDGDINLFLKAFNNHGHGKILAEPTLVTLSGHTATFISGGEFAVPTAVGVGGIGAASTSFRGFGTMLTFTPTVIDKDRIRMRVAPSFSKLNGSSVDGIPGLDTRAVTTTVDLREGQWLAIAGLIQDQQGGARSALPFLGSVPLLGALFGNQTTSRDESELVVLVSPELVHPLDAEQVPFILPGMEVTETTDHQFFLHQRLEGDEGRYHRSTVAAKYRNQLRAANWEAIHAAKTQLRAHADFHTHQQYYISGESGFSP